jgi:hypothetical protein
MADIVLKSAAHLRRAVREVEFREFGPPPDYLESRPHRLLHIFRWPGIF